MAKKCSTTHDKNQGIRDNMGQLRVSSSRTSKSKGGGGQDRDFSASKE